MSKSVLIIGESGSGKSTSISSLPSNETFIINVMSKPLPFRGHKKMYTRLSSDGLSGNYYSTDDSKTIVRLLNLINDKRPEIKYIIIDDYGYSMSNTFMRKAMQKGYDKFTEIAYDGFTVLNKLKDLREDLFCFVIMHTELDIHGKYKPKTIGKMTDQYVCIEGIFTYVLHAITSDRNYKFLTNTDSSYIAKTPIGMFEKLYIDNDLMSVVNAINDYEGDSNNE